MIRRYSSDVINDHKTHGKWKVHSVNKVINYKTEGEWEIQLSMIINLFFLKILMKLCILCIQKVIL